MKLYEVLGDEIPNVEIAEFDPSRITDALKSQKPAVELKDVFGEAFWPKISRWLDDRLKDIKLSPEEKNIVGAPLRPKLEKYLRKKSDQYDLNAEALTREILNIYNEWEQEQIKDLNLPPGRFMKKEKE